MLKRRRMPEDKEHDEPPRKTSVQVLTLDPKATHANNPDCPSRLAHMPNGHWACMDCGFQILQRWVRCTVDD
jgi:hypothetical protein